VIRRAPQEFKVACLADIRALFPSDASPFYAGFGNRATDVASYVAVGVPPARCFTINPKGVVVREGDGTEYTLGKLAQAEVLQDFFPGLESPAEAL